MFVERDCTVEHNGRKFTAIGAYYNTEYAVGYLIDGAIPPEIRTWHGEPLGEARIVKRWPIRSYFSDRMYQVEACINGVFYTGRSMGGGLLWRGKRKAKQEWSV